MAGIDNQPLANSDSIKRLFRAFRDGNLTAFRGVAEKIISEALAANRHGLAKELRQALGDSSATLSKEGAQTGLRGLRKSGAADELLSVFYEPASTDHLLLCDDSRRRLDRFIEERSNASKLARFGYHPKSKLLLWGPPGCGKTLAAHYLANELNLRVGVVRLSGLISSFMGETAANIQRVFDTAQASPMVLLLDEIDSVAKSRDDQHDVGELKRVVNGLLQSIDMFSCSESILVGASNHQYMLDPAIWRRFDDVVFFPLPNPSLRKKFIDYHLNGVSFGGSISSLVKKTAGMSFADIERILAEAIKSMILDDSDELNAAHVNRELKHMEASRAALVRNQVEVDES